MTGTLLIAQAATEALEVADKLGTGSGQYVLAVVLVFTTLAGVWAVRYVVKFVEKIYGEMKDRAEKAEGDKDTEKDKRLEDGQKFLEKNMKILMANTRAMGEAVEAVHALSHKVDQLQEGIEGLYKEEGEEAG